MSEYGDPADDRRRKERREGDDLPEAEVHMAGWSPWVWVIPVLAVFFVGWLVVRYGFFGGGDITVRFVEARGLDRYSPVRFRGAKVGTVQKITIDENLKEVVVRISMDASMNHALKKGTSFWIVEPGLETGSVGGLLSGTYVAIEPGEGEDTREFVGQEHAPILGAPEAGKTIILEAEAGTSIHQGSGVFFNGMRVGRILGSEYDPSRGISNIHAFIVQRHADHVRQSTRFYRTGGLNVSLAGGRVSMGDASLTSLLNAGISFYTPDVFSGAPVGDLTRFELHGSEAEAIASADGPHLTYVTYFPGPIGGLAPGTPVQMKGVEVGHVREVRLRYVAETASLETPVTLEIDPRRLEVDAKAHASRVDLRNTMNGVLDQLVRKGMRASLSTSLVLPGAGAVSLDVVASPNTARLNTSTDPPVIPAAAGGSGIEGALGAIGDVATTIRNLPLREIAENMRSASVRLNAVMNDPAIDQSLEKLNRSLTEIERVAVTAGQNVDPIATSLRNAVESAESAAETIDRTAQTASASVEPIVQSLRNAAAAAESAASRAEQLIGTSQKQGYDIGELVRELTRAAEAVRALANFLAENPDALLKGRAK
jgi:paraquat-inducible protein B